MDEKALEPRGQLPSTVPFVPFKGRYDGLAEEVIGLLTPGLRGLANCRARGARKDKVKQNLTGLLGVVSRQHVDGQQSIKFVSKRPQSLTRRLGPAYRHQPGAVGVRRKRHGTASTVKLSTSGRPCQDALDSMPPFHCRTAFRTSPCGRGRRPPVGRRGCM
ncbi:hypothetical protein ACWGI9_24395 [Streptomyces sp. NPDC054833]